MKIHLVIWEECDSGFEIKGAFRSLDKAEAEAKRLNTVEQDEMLADTERHILEHPDSIQRCYRGLAGEQLSLEDAIAFCRESAKDSAAKYCIKHSVYSVKVE
jgi:hypothetical protein